MPDPIVVAVMGKAIDIGLASEVLAEKGTSLGRSVTSAFMAGMQSGLELASRNPALAERTREALRGHIRTTHPEQFDAARAEWDAFGERMEEAARG